MVSHLLSLVQHLISLSTDIIVKNKYNVDFNEPPALANKEQQKNYKTDWHSSEYENFNGILILESKVES